MQLQKSISEIFWSLYIYLAIPLPVGRPTVKGHGYSRSSLPAILFQANQEMEPQ